MMSGIEMMLKSMGVDPQKIIADFELLKKNVTETLQSIETRLSGIETKQGEILCQMKTQQSQPAQQPAQHIQPMPPTPLPTLPPAKQ